jgi:signal transduction histidine kinase/CheY-like chemotaxis protein
LRRLALLFLLVTAAVHAQAPRPAAVSPSVVARVDRLIAAAEDSETPAERRTAAAEALSISRRAGYTRGVGLAQYEAALATYFAGEPGAEAQFERAAATARRARDPKTEGTALAWQGMAATDAGPDAQARGVALMRAGLAVHRAQAGPEGQRNSLTPLNLLANYYRFVGEPDSARVLFEETVRTAVALGDGEAEGRALYAVADLQRAAGDVVPAARAYRRAERLATDAGDEARADLARLGLARIDAAQGQTDAAARAFRRLADAGRLGGALGYASEPLVDLGALYEAQNRPAQALAAYREMARAADDAGVPYAHDLANVYAAGVLFRLGRRTDARAALHPSADSLLSMGTSQEVSAAVYRLFATEARLDGRPAEAVAFARQATEAADGADDAGAARDAYAELAESLDASGDARGALRAFRRSAALTDSLRSTAQARAVGRAEGETARAAAEAQSRQARLGAGALAALLALGAAGGGVYRRTVRRNARDADARTAEIARQAGELEAANADLAQTNAVVREAQDAQARFFQTASHELRTPLTLTLGPLDDLRQTPLGADAQRSADLAHANATRLARLVDELLDTARLDAGEMPHRPVRTDLVGLASGVAARFADAAARDGVTLTAHVPAGTLDAVVDGEALDRALANLVANALRHTPRGGHVEVRASAAHGEARLAVVDTGSGVAADALPHVFDRFYRADETSGIGTGLGLALAKEWTERDGGRVEVVSAPGAGATFTLVLPLADPHALPESGSGLAVDPRPTAIQPVSEARDAEAPDADLPDAEALVVLVAEDHDDLRAYVAGHLARIGGSRPVHVVEAADGEAALALAIDLVPDLVVSDVMMPRRDGMSLARALKADVRTSHVPVLLLTARADAASQVEGYTSGADGYLAKPFSADVLRAQAAGLVAERQRLRDRYAAALRPALPRGGLDGGGRDGSGLVLTGDGLDGASSDGRRAGMEPADPTLSPAETRFLDAVDAAIALGVGDALFGAETLAEALALSPRQLARKLKALSGDTPGRRLRRARVEAGAALLAAGTHSVKEVAASVGYADDEGFRRAFVAVRGGLPSAIADTLAEA